MGAKTNKYHFEALPTGKDILRYKNEQATYAYNLSRALRPVDNLIFAWYSAI